MGAGYCNKEQDLNYCDENACLYYEADYDEVYKRIEKIEDPVEFAYAVLESVVNVRKHADL